MKTTIGAQVVDLNWPKKSTKITQLEEKKMKKD